MLFLIFCNVNSLANEIVLIELYSIPFNRTYIVGIDKKNISKNYDIEVRIKDIELINSLNVEQIVNNLKLSDSLYANSFGDFRAIAIIRFKNGKSRRFYVSGTGHIIEKNKVYDTNLDFLKMIYSFFSTNFRPYYPVWETSK